MLGFGGEGNYVVGNSGHGHSCRIALDRLDWGWVLSRHRHHDSGRRTLLRGAGIGLIVLLGTALAAFALALGLLIGMRAL